MAPVPDNMVMKLEADFITTFEELKDTLDKYSDVYMTLKFDQDNFRIIRTYHAGLRSMSEAMAAMADCFESLCHCKEIYI